jgi:predicted nucleic acid-binding protein
VRFVDTNVLLYAVSRDPAEEDKAAIASAILEHRDLALSTQVLQEFYVQATRVTRGDALPHETAVGLAEAFSRFHVEPITLAIVSAALTSRDRYRLSYWDSTVIEAARSAKCEVVLSEDLSDGQNYGGVQVVNPFRGVGR